MFDGSHSHGGGSGGAHSHGTGSGGGAGFAVAIVVGVLAAVLLGWILFDAISNTIKENNDKKFNQQDMSIRSAKVMMKCRALEISGRVPQAGPACSSATRSAALIIELKGLPAGAHIGHSALEGQYYGTCTVLNSAREADTPWQSEFLTKPSSTEINIGPNLFPTKITLPGNACAISPYSDSRYVKITIIRWGRIDGQQYVIRQIIEKINPSWYRLDESLYNP